MSSSAYDVPPSLVVSDELIVEEKVTARTGGRQSLMVGPLSGLIEVSCSHPLDRVKTKLQEMALSSRRPSLSRSMAEIYRESGLRGFYAGYTARVLGVMPMRLVYWETMRAMNKVTEGESLWVQLLVPGLVVGVAQTSIDNPIEVIKVRLMTGGTKFSLKDSFKGFLPCLVRNTIFSVTVSAAVKVGGEDQPFLAAAFGGLLGSVLSQPFDVVKTDIQRHNSSASNKGMISLLAELACRNPRELFAGTVMRSAMSFVNMGVGFLAFHHIYNLVSHY